MKKLKQELEKLTDEEIKQLFNRLKRPYSICQYFECHHGESNIKLIKIIANRLNIDFNELIKTPPRFCLNCGKKLLGHNKNTKVFCNHSCSAIYNNKIRAKKKEYAHCLYCGKELNNQKKYCDQICQNKKRSDEAFERFLSNPNGKEINYSIRKYIIGLKNNRCECCGWNKRNEYTKLIPLQIHHIDGNCLNNDLSNLQVLCPNCHSLTENFGSNNKKSFRSIIKQPGKRYNKGE